MKRICCVLLCLFFGFCAIEAQNLPSWIRVGLTKDEIQRQINDGWPTNELMENMDPNIFGYFNREGLRILFHINPAKGLEQVFIKGGILSDLSFTSTIADFTKRYGQSRIRNDSIYYFNRNLPTDVEMILVTRTDDDDSAEIVYFLKGTFFL
jgi:hypothetical protein